MVAGTDRAVVRDRIGHAFADPALLAQALTHRSAGAPHNERLEFLGDGVVNLIAAEALYQRWPKADEGVLTRARAELVREASLDAGYEGCRKVVLPWFEQALAALPVGRPEKDAKTRLQEWLQARQLPRPAYELVSESGEEHAKLFLARCTLSEPAVEAEGQGTSRRLAEQAAAAAVLDRLEPASRHS